MAGFPIHRVRRLDLRVTPWRWPFAQARRAAIDSHFAGLRRRTPQLWNGRVLLGRDPVFDGDTFHAEYFETDFASFIAWRDWGYPDATVFNGFGMGALRGRDGAYALGEMAAHTANAGQIYFAAGTPDLDDIRDGKVDIAGSVAREVAEETGLTQADYRAAEAWDCVVAGPLIALMRDLASDLDGEALRRRIEANLARQATPELAAIHLMRSRRDITPAVPPYMAAFLTARLPEAGIA
ncbi:MAG: NUDIX hydrolase [Xanthobacteraceae bacterium]|nr:NUDIX hydrolase [Xanthobacteraceae bacterium]